MKKKLIKELQKAQLEFNSKFSNKLITRDYFRQYLKSNDINFIESDYLLNFGSFSNFKEAAGITEKSLGKNNLTRSDIDIVRNDSKTFIKRKYFVSAIIAGAPIHDRFINTVENYCKKNNADLILLVMRGVRSSDEFTDQIYEKYKKYFATTMIFNNNLKAMDFLIAPQQILPLTGLRRFGSKDHSVIVASPKQFLDTIPQKQTNSKNKKYKLPHIILTSGTINIPEYAQTRQGRLSTQDNLIGGLIVEIEDTEIFHIRQIQSDKLGGFQDLDTYYLDETCKKVAAEAISSEPHYGAEDPIALKATKEIIKKTNCQRIFFHDILDSRSVNPHESDNIVAKLDRPVQQKTLESELNYLGEKLLEWNKEFPDLKMYVVASNHDRFIFRWLIKGDFVFDPYNAYIGSDLFKAILRQENPIEWYLKEKFPDIKNLTFLAEDDSFIIKGIEWATHGHEGANGSRGSKTILEVVHGNATVGHTHAPFVYRGVYGSGCDCILFQFYNKSGGSSWLPSNVIGYVNGSRQNIIKINGKWHLA